MALFRSVVQGTAASDVVAEDNFVAFARANKGYYVINNSGSQKTKFAFENRVCMQRLLKN
jgi:hypothetical protein